MLLVAANVFQNFLFEWEVVDVEDVFLWVSISLLPSLSIFVGFLLLTSCFIRSSPNILFLPLRQQFINFSFLWFLRLFLHFLMAQWQRFLVHFIAWCRALLIGFLAEVHTTLAKRFDAHPTTTLSQALLPLHWLDTGIMHLSKRSLIAKAAHSARIDMVVDVNDKKSFCDDPCRFISALYIPSDARDAKHCM